jgi:hypothetical protein
MRHLDRLASLMFESGDRAPAEQQRHTAEDPEAAVDKTPREWYASDVTSDKGQRKDSGAANQTKTDYPLIADRIEVRADERNGNH